MKKDQKTDCTKEILGFISTPKASELLKKRKLYGFQFQDLAVREFFASRIKDHEVYHHVNFWEDEKIEINYTNNTAPCLTGIKLYEQIIKDEFTNEVNCEFIFIDDQEIGSEIISFTVNAFNSDYKLYIYV